MEDSGDGNAAERGTSAELGALLRAAVDAIVLSDARGTIIGFNPAAERLFGYAADEVLGRPLELLMPEPYRSEHGQYMRRYLETGKARIIGLGREVRARKRGGEVFPIWLSVGEAVNGETRNFVGIIRDLTDEKAAEQERRSLEGELAHVGRFSLMGEMVAGIAHEINQPLAAIASYSEAATRLLNREAVDPDSLRRACVGIAEQARRASRVIENLRNLIRKQEAKKEWLDLNEVIRDTMSLVEADAGGDGIAVAVEYAESLPSIRGNRVQLQQVLLNLTRNAVDAMSDAPREAKRITIRTGGQGTGGVYFSVADRGPGIPERLAQAVFEPFVSTKREGLGVGLAISRTIVEAHGGELSHESDPAGGTVFVARMPISKGGSDEQG